MGNPKSSDISVHSLNDINAELCRRSFYFFVQYFWDTVIGEAPVWNWHIKYLCDEMQGVGERVFLRLPKEHDYIIINVPPGSSKSTIASEMYPLWCWTRDAAQRFICGSYASTPAEDIADKCFKIYNSEKYQALFPKLHNRNTKGGKTHFHNGLLGERYTTSTGSSVTGMHAHQKIIDDPMNPKIAASKTERDTANKWVSETLSSRNVSDELTVTFVIMQRLHSMDTTGYLLSKKGLRIKHICIPLELNEHNKDDVKPAALKKFYIDGLFDPKRRPRSAIPKLKEDLGTYGYAGQMQQRPAPAEGGIIKKEWFNFIDRAGAQSTSRPIKFQIDTAFTDDTKNDPTGVVAYYKEMGNIYIVNRAVVYKEMPELIRWLPIWLKENGYDHRSMIRVEPKANGISVVQTIAAATNLNIKKDKAPTDDKITRLYVAQPKIEAGRIILHRATWNDDFIAEICVFPNGEHDEMVDCLSAIVKNELIDEGGIDPTTFIGAMS